MSSVYLLCSFDKYVIATAAADIYRGLNFLKSGNILDGLK